MAIATKETFGKALGKSIRTARKKKGISMRQFELHKNSINRDALSNIEQGKIAPTVYTLYRIASVIGVTVEDLVRGL